MTDQTTAPAGVVSSPELGDESTCKHCDNGWLIGEGGLDLGCDKCNFDGPGPDKKEQPRKEAGSHVVRSNETSRQSVGGQAIVSELNVPHKIQTTPPVRTPLDRAIDLHENASMPWDQAEELALAEAGFGNAEIDELIGNASPSAVLSMLHEEELREFVRSILVHQYALQPNTPISGPSGSAA